MDRLDELSVLVAIESEGSLIAAARKLRRSPASITRSLANLEKRTGLGLVDRSTRHASTTEAGMQLVQQAKSIMSKYDDAIRSTGSGSLEGRIRITAPVIFGRMHVVPIVASFLAAYKEVSVDLVLSDRHLDLVDEEIHVGIRIGKISKLDLIARRLGTVQKIIVASPEYLELRGVPCTPSDLTDHDILALTGKLQTQVWSFLAGKKGYSVKLGSRIEVNDVFSKIELTLAGLGVATVLNYQVAEELKDGRLVRVLKKYEEPPSPVHLVAPASIRKSARVDVWWNHALENLKKISALKE